MTRPLIGITGPDHGQQLTKVCLWLAVLLQGGRPVKLRPALPLPQVELDGLIVAGGVDVDPHRYGQERKVNYAYDEPRDRLEAGLIQLMLDKKRPILGICRGAQLLNIVLGGTLYMDIRLVYDRAKYPGGLISKIVARKWIYLTEGSRLRELLGRKRVRVNSLHRQSLHAIGTGLVVTAQEANTIVQGVEATDRSRFVFGVQWHPELMQHEARQRGLFKALIAASRAAG